MRALILTLAALLSAVGPASAQYFGRNKVQVEHFAFRILPTAHFDIYYYPAERDAAVDAARMAERWYDRLSNALDHTLTVRPPIVLYASHAQFSQTTVIPGLLSDGIGGFTDHDRGRVVLPFAASLRETDHVLGHELVHAFQRDILRRAGRSVALLPLWFSEGMAEYLSVGEVDSNTRMWLRDAVDHDHIPTIAQLDDPKFFPYRYGQALWAYLSARYGETIAARALKSTAKNGAIGRLTAVTGDDEPALSRGWHRALRDELGERPDAPPRSADATVVVGRDTRRGRMNVGPALSPDGTQLVFLSERDGYSIDVFLANATTGAVTRKLVSTAADPHFDSLQFLESAGAWDPSGARFAIGTLQNGRPALTILDMPRGDIARERRFDDLDEIFSPTWSPDGREIAFSAMSAGTTDLYVYDTVRDTLRQLTNDANADLQPAWSPDGRTIAFVTDRFTSSVGALTFGEYRLAMYDVASGAIAEVAHLPRAKHIDPQWAGTTLYFVSDLAGVSNVYRLDTMTGAVARVTDAREGVSGITALSPALSVAARADRVAFSEYDAGAYDIHVARASTLSALDVTSAVSIDETILDVEVPPPAPPLETFDPKPYRRTLMLSGLGQPYVSAGGGMLGGYFRAGMSMAFSDLLEDQQVATAVQFGSTAADFAVQTAYVNRQSRWNWGVVGSQVPLEIGSERLLPNDTPSGQTLTRETDVLRQTRRGVGGVTMYPFSAAARLELSAGVSSISFDREIATQVYARGGSLVTEGNERGPVASSLTLFDTAAAYVYDTAVFGSTAPVLGSRYRFEIAPTFGGAPLVTLTADYRRYLMPIRPVTVAFRVQHVGRYGEGAGDPRLLPLVWDLRDLVRGYDVRDVLNTSRMTIGNVELRVPIIGPFGRVSGSNVLPLDAVLFADAGRFASAPIASLVASMTDTAANRASTLLRSVGAGVRFNVGGFVFEFDGARRFDLAPRGWTLAINFQPGF